MQYFNNSSNHLKAIKMLSSNHLMKNCFRNSLLLAKSLTNNGIYSLHNKCFNHFVRSNSCQNRHKLLAEYKAVLRTLRNSNLLVLSSNDCSNKWIHSSHCYYNNNQNKDPKNKSQTNNSRNNDNEDNKEDDEPKSSLLAKAVIWMLTGFVISN
jgi:hypothetical protein